MIGELKTEYARLKSEYEKQHVAFKDDYPEVRALLGRMDSIDKRIVEEEIKIFATVRNQFEAAAQKKAALEKRVDEQRRLAMDLNQRTTQYKIMAREVETNKQIYQSLLDEIEADNFQVMQHRIRLTPLRKFWIAWTTARRERRRHRRHLKKLAHA